MGRNLAARVQYYLATRRQNRRRAVILRCLALVVAFATAYALVMPAVTQSNALLCGKEAHIHTEECWTEEMIAPQPELVCTAGQDGEIVVHTHDERCYDRNGELICPLRERELHIHSTGCYRQHRELICEERQVLGHTHGPSCYTYVRGDLICGLEETSGHTHTDACYRTERGDTPDCGLEEGGGHTHTDACYRVEPSDVPDCGLEEGGHVHTDACYTEERGDTPDCGKEESEGHTHTDDCYTEKEVEVLTCGQTESEGHTHTSACYPVEEVLTCDQEEDEEHTHTSACYTERRSTEPDCGKRESEGHTHTGDCYTTKTERTLTCNQKENRGHTHTSACYPTERVLTCLLEEGGEHVHTDACYPERRTLICGQKESEGHTHTDACYPEEKVLICQEEERGHTHTDECYEWIKELHCQEEERESGHVHTDECYEITELLACREEELILHVHTDECYEYTYDEETGEIVDTVLVCDKPEVILHQHTDECFVTPEGEPTQTRVLTCGKEEHVHTEECYVEIIPKEENIYLCGQKEHVHTSECYFDSGELKCTLPEHIHSVDCLEEPPEMIEIPEEPLEPRPDRVELDDYFDYESDAFHATFHVTGIASLIDEDSAPPSVDSGDGQQPEGPAAEPDINDGGEPDDTAPAAGDTGDTSAPGDAGEAGGGDEDSVIISGDTDVPLADTPDQTDISDATEDLGRADAADATEDLGRADAADEAEDFGWSDAADATEDLSWADSAVQEDPIQIEFQVNEPDPDSREYQEIAASVPESETEKIILSVLTFSVSASDGREVDLSRCSIEAEVEFKEELVDALVNMSADTMAIDSEDDEVQSTETPEVRIAALADETSEDDEAGKPSELSAVVLSTAEPVSAPATLSFSVSPQSRSVFFTAEVDQYPKFTVQYYANLNRPAKRSDEVDGKPVSYAAALPFIDTSSAVNGGKGPVLPANGATLVTSEDDAGQKKGAAELLLDSKGNVIYVTELRELFRSAEVQYSPVQEELIDSKHLGAVTSGNIRPINPDGTINDSIIAEESDHYQLKEIRVYPNGVTEGKENDSSTYTAYSAEAFDALEFTNSAKTAHDDKEGKTVLVTDSLVIRMIYDVADENNAVVPATLYDYDITDGKDSTDKYPSAANGINSTVNCDKQIKYAFGGDNTNTNYGRNQNNGSNINMSNLAGKGNGPTKPGYKGCSFGLVSGLDKNGLPKFNVGAPAIFGGENQNGKYFYGDQSLNFKRNGDTYILSTVAGTNAGTDPKNSKDGPHLEKFSHPGSYSIWTNHFWPMDDIGKKADDSGKMHQDPLFGDGKNDCTFYGAVNAWGSTTSGAPGSDDGLDHNSYFGMSFAINFTLQESYIGPLEYYFYGDDDMWVFLDGKLICDIGGVHSSVGEYVNLWDYIDKDDREGNQNHRLDFFYTERGASGSTCWMQFTIPNMVGASQDFETPSDEDNYLRIQKTVEGDESRKNEEFSFNLKLTGTGDEFAAVKHTVYEDGTTEDVTLEKMVQGGEDYPFTLKNGEYLMVYPIPTHAHYELTEDTSGLTNCKTTFRVNGKDQPAGTTCSGSMTGEDGKTTYVSAVCTNTFYYQLPETGGPGDYLYIWAGTLLIAAAGCLWYKKQTYRGGARDES